MHSVWTITTHPTTTHAPQDEWEPPLLVTSLPDGVSISGSEDLLQIVASWDIFVSLEPPPFPADLAERVAELESTFESVSKLANLGVSMDLQPFKIRRQRLQQILQLRVQRASRVKRGLLDIGGTILHHLFGVATESQLARYKATMIELHGRQEEIAHAYGTLSTVVNQTRTYVKQLAIQQRHLHD